MNRSFTARLALALLALPLLGGCTSKVTAPTGTMTQQTADDIAVQAAANMGVLNGDLQFAVSTSPQPAPSGARRARPVAALWDTTFVYGGITFQASRSFYDALDNLLPGYGPLATRLRWTSRAYGTYQGPRDTAIVGHAAVLDIRGIEVGQDTLKLDGTCQDTLQNTFRSLDGLTTRYFLWISGMTVNTVRLLKSTYGSGGPLDGTVTFVASADRLRSNNRGDVDIHYDATVVITFNGTLAPEIVVNGSYHYHWNLATGSITRG